MLGVLVSLTMGVGNRGAVAGRITEASVANWLGSALTLLEKIAPEPPEPTPEELQEKLQQEVETLVSPDFPVEEGLVLENNEHLTVTILPELQKQIQEMIASYDPPEAAIVALDPKTGEILALVGYQNGQFSHEIALSARAPAASIFKIVTAAALLEGERLSPQATECYARSADRGIRPKDLIRDSKRDTRCTTLSRALADSNNAVFGRMADEYLSRKEMASFAESLGFNRVLPFQWPIEISRAQIPQDKLERARTAAGFGKVQLSAIHAALMVASVGNHGILMEPKIVESVTDAQGKTVYSHASTELMRTMNERTARRLTRMMVSTTEDGTASRYFKKRKKTFSGMEVAGKTGSLSGTLDGQRTWFSWFVGFAPADEPQIAIAVMIANPVDWKVKASLVAREALVQFFKVASRP